MLRSNLARLKDFILQYNPYFNQGFDDVVMDETTGIVHNNQPVFPADEYGDYFYLRHVSTRFDTGSQYQVSECIKGFGLQANLVLVACMRDADPDKLQSNLFNTLSAYPVQIRLNDALFLSEQVLLKELARVKAENVAAALQRLDPGYTIVSIDFSLTELFNTTSLRCFETPCKSC